MYVLLAGEDVRRVELLVRGGVSRKEQGMYVMIREMYVKKRGCMLGKGDACQ